MIHTPPYHLQQVISDWHSASRPVRGIVNAVVIENLDSPFAREPSPEAKLVHLDAETAISENPAMMKCSLPPHQPLSFPSFEDYDVHYQKNHVNRCSECGKNFPDEHFLHLHIAENHDPINEAKRARGEKTYACLLADCDRMCSTPQKRRLHCIDKHLFPKFYDFFIVNDGIDRRNTMLRPHRRRSSTANSNSRRKRGDSSANGEAVGMDVVNDDGEEEGKGQENEKADPEAQDPPRSPVALRGRGGFRGKGRGRGAGRGKVGAAQSPPAADPVDSITSSMSALKFVPNSVRFGRGRGRGGLAKS
ncbi:hypothetical protein K469DRAFT_734504 [Zopfia rhizophila CBS 207.26]|uniref:C2H2-type domain-containing protein n=1 Tax=Zopfia rhizophila CBS 207.26 TaxID=1314779 RepID=A0A6A6EV27_9PEZI|nr:hypothetical protein K469DRAFT_734504 [Zopfia rhizophila CBS 207.26]